MNAPNPHEVDAKRMPSLAADHGAELDNLAMREGILRLNDQHRDLLSNDLGAIGGLLFVVGSGRFKAPPRADDADALAAWEPDVVRVREQNAAALKAARTAQERDRTHTEVQSWLCDLGFALMRQDRFKLNRDVTART